MKTALWQCCALVAKWEDVTVLTSHLLDERWGEGNWKGQSWWQTCSYYKLQAQNIAIWKIIQGTEFCSQNFYAPTVNFGSSGKQNEIANHGSVMSVCKVYGTAFDETGYERCVQPFCFFLWG